MAERPQPWETELPHLSLYRRVTAAALVVAPALLLADNLLHPKEYERGEEARQLAEIGEHYTRWQLAHFLGFLGILAFAAAILGLAFLVRRRSPGAGLVGGGLAMLGLLSLASVIALDGFTWGILGEIHAQPGNDAKTVERTLHDVQQSEWALPFYATTTGWLAGWLVLAVAAARGGALPAWLGALLGLGAVLVGTEGVIVSNAYYVAGAAVLLLAGALTAVHLWRMNDEQFADGGPPPRPEAGDRA
jgi:hypothetical protein